MLVAASSPDGHSLATLKHGSKSGKRCGRIRLYPVSGCKSKLSAELPNYVNGLAFPPDGKRLYAAVDNHSLRQSRRPRPHVCVPPRRTVDGHAGTGREKNWQIPNAVLVYEVFAGRLIARLESARASRSRSALMAGSRSHPTRMCSTFGKSRPVKSYCTSRRKIG